MKILDTSDMTHEEWAKFWQVLYNQCVEEVKELHEDQAEKAARYRQAEFAMQELEDLGNRGRKRLEYKNRQAVGNDV